MAAAVLPLRTQLPCYSHILWLPFALLCAPALAGLIETGKPRAVSWLWLILGLILLPIALLNAEFRPALLPASGRLIGRWLGPTPKQPLQSPRRQQRWWPFGGWACYCSSAGRSGTGSSMNSGRWLLLRFWSKALIQTCRSPFGDQSERPSLSWQSQRRLQPLKPNNTPPEALQLLNPPGAPIPEVAGQQCRQQGSSEDGWLLWLCIPSP